MAVVVLALSGCGYGMETFGCAPDAELEPTVEHLRARDLGDVADRMDLRCHDDLSGLGRCRADVDACTIQVGGPLVRGIAYVNHRVTTSNAVCHEAGHWRLWSHPDACSTHDPGCGWDPGFVDDCNHLR